MTTATATLADFLLARISDDEAVARAANPSPWHRVSSSVHNEDHGIASTTAYGFSERNSSEAEHIARHDPARVLADCAARRAIVEMGGSRCGSADDDDLETLREMGLEPERHYPDGYASGCDGCSAAEAANMDHAMVLRHLAAPYASHPDYDPTWSIA